VHRLAPWLPALLALAGWWKLRDLLYGTHWGRGPTIFLLLLLSIALVVVVPYLARVVARDAAAGSRELADRSVRRGWLLAIVLLGAALWALADDVRELPNQLAKQEAPLLDIGGNTWAAAVRFTDFGQNPYTHRTQLVPVTGAPGVSEENGRVTMFGVPYYYGFPYFPAMFLSYAPFRVFERGQHSIRIGNAFWLAVILVGAAWLAYRLAPEGRRSLAGGLAVLLVAITTGLGSQLFHFGITDMLIAAYVLLGLIALTYGRDATAGGFIGLAFSAKLLPGLLVAAVFFAWIARRGNARRALYGFAVTTAIVLLPFLLWNPAGFFSATILYYLTHHAAGDTTSLWYYLPPALRLPFLALGGLAILAVVLWTFHTESDDPRDLLRAIVIATFLFIAFNKMIHLNYQFVLVPLACVVLAADAMGPWGTERLGRRWVEPPASHNP
jgi:hypothetical protein